MLIKCDEIKKILTQKKIQITGVFHIGSHECEEMNFYKELNLQEKDVVWIDALSEKVDQAKKKGITNVYQAVITDVDDSIVNFNVSNNNQSSSVLEFGTHKVEHPHIHFVRSETLQSVTVNSFFERNHLDGKKYNFWNIDIQGAELMALMGATKYIPFAKALYLEVNEKELYKNCPLIGDIDNFLINYGFKRVLTKMTCHGWGDALYIKEN
jgi:hypothetical protein